MGGVSIYMFSKAFDVLWKFLVPKQLCLTVVSIHPIAYPRHVHCCSRQVNNKRKRTKMTLLESLFDKDPFLFH